LVGEPEVPLGARVALVFLLACGAAHAEVLEARVTHVADGDSLSVCVEHREVRIRLVNIDAPEYQQPFGLESRKSLVEMCENKLARVDWAKEDRYGRKLGQVSCGGVDVNAEQVRRGLAWVSRLDQPAGSLFSAERAARTGRIGLWADADAVPPWKWRRANTSSSPWKGVSPRAC
jgi:endonuclease YncB( thermonuclease family)